MPPPILQLSGKVASREFSRRIHELPQEPPYRKSGGKVLATFRRIGNKFAEIRVLHKYGSSPSGLELRQGRGGGHLRTAARLRQVLFLSGRLVSLNQGVPGVMVERGCLPISTRCGCKVCVNNSASGGVVTIFQE